MGGPDKTNDEKVAQKSVADSIRRQIADIKAGVPKTPHSLRDLTELEMAKDKKKRGRRKG